MIKELLCVLLPSFLLLCCESASNSNLQDENLQLSNDSTEFDEFSIGGEQNSSDTSSYLALDKGDEGIAFRVLELPFDNSGEGVPFFEDDLGFYVAGFDVDKNENLYFMGGQDQSRLVKFSGEKFLWHRYYENLDQSKIHIQDDSTILTLNDKYGKNELVQINAENGEIRNSLGKVLANTINDFFFNDSTLIVESYNISDTIVTDTPSGYVVMDFRGNLLYQAENIFGRERAVFVNPFEKNSMCHFVGDWNGLNLVFESSVREYSIRLVDKNGTTQAQKTFSVSEIKNDLWSDDKERTKLVGNNLYFLGKDRYNAVVTVIDLKRFFGEEN